MASATTQSHDLPSASNTSQSVHSNAVELNNLETIPAASAVSNAPLSDLSIPSAFMASTTSDTRELASQQTPSALASTTTAAMGNEEPPQNADTAAAIPNVSTTSDAEHALAEPAPVAQLARLDSVAIGPSTDTTPIIHKDDSADPVCIITLLLTSGARHPYKLDEKYLSKRNVNVPELTAGGKKDPFSISVYTLKELILREWREEWEAQPSSPSSIRLIHFGRLLDDKSPLNDCRFNADTPNVVHMTVKPQDIVDDEEASKGKSGGREREATEATPGCRCVIL